MAARKARRRRVPPRFLHTVRGVGFRFTAPSEWGHDAARAALLVLAYVLVLAIGSMLVPLVRSVRDRIWPRWQQASSQAEVVAATRPAASTCERLVVTAAREVRGRVLIVDARGVVVADSSPGGVGADYSSRPEIARRWRGRTAQDERESRRSDEPILATAVPVCATGGRTARCGSPRASTRSTGRCARRPGSCRGRIVLASGWARARSWRRASCGRCGGWRRGARGRARATLRARGDRGLAGAARGRAGVQRDDRAGAADGRCAARLRRRRLPPAAHAADRLRLRLEEAAATGWRGSRRRAGRRSIVSRTWSTSCSC